MSIQISKSPTLADETSLRVEEVSTPKSVNFGPGMEMFMNDKRSRPNSSAHKSSSQRASEINLDDLDDLNNIESSAGTSRKEWPTQRASSPMPMKINVDDDTASIGASSFLHDNDTKEINTTTKKPEPRHEQKGFMSLFGLGNTVQEPASTNADQNTSGQSSGPSLGSLPTQPTLGRSTANVKEDTGMPTFKDIPVHPDMDTKPVSKPKRSHEETLREKFKYLRRLEQLEQKGAKLTKQYSMESDLEEMMGEYNMLISEKEKQNSIKFQAKMLMGAITGLEYLNNKVNPFDLQLDGWAESVNENISDYDEIFSELHEKYSGKAKMMPELKLMLMLGGSAVMLHMTNTMFKSAMPGMDDIMRQNPELMQQFTKAAASSMGQQNPGFGDFMGNMMGGQEQTREPAPSMRPPRETRETREPPMPAYEQPSAESSSARRVMETRKEQKSAPRPEMKGPSDLGDILSRLKPKGGLGDMSTAPERTMRYPEQDRSQRPQQSQQQQQGGMPLPPKQRINPFGDSPETRQSRRPQAKQEQRSTISIQELTEMQKDMEKTTRRRGRSERNTISLDV